MNQILQGVWRLSIAFNNYLLHINLKINFAFSQYFIGSMWFTVRNEDGETAFGGIQLDFFFPDDDKRYDGESQFFEYTNTHTHKK